MTSWGDALAGFAAKGLVAVFLSLFAIPGLTCAGLLAYHLWNFAETGGWADAQCTIDHAEIAIDDSDGDKVYSNKATYHYERDGRTYQGSRVALIGGGGSNDRESHDLRNAELQEAVRSGKPIACLVNRVIPSESLLYRELRPVPLILLAGFAVVFTGIGVGGFYTLFFSRSKS